MRYTKLVIHSIGNSIVKHNHRMHSDLTISLVLVLLSLPFFSCAPYTMLGGKYEEPDLPKSELAIIQFDTKGEWLHWTSQYELRIHGKLAVRKELKKHQKHVFNEILVAPGKHYISVMVYTPSINVRSLKQKTRCKFSTELIAGRTYIVKITSYHLTDGGIVIELIDKVTGKVVSKKIQYIKYN